MSLKKTFLFFLIFVFIGIYYYLIEIKKAEKTKEIEKEEKRVFFPLKKEEISDIAISLRYEKRLVFDFATEFRYKNETIASIENFEITDEIFNNFVEFLSDKEYQYTTATEDALDIFKEITDDEGTSDLISEEFNLLTEKIKLNKENDLANNKFFDM